MEVLPASGPPLVFVESGDISRHNGHPQRKVILEADLKAVSPDRLRGARRSGNRLHSLSSIGVRDTHPRRRVISGTGDHARQAASASGIPIHGGPTYNAATQTGYSSPTLPGVLGSTAGNGTAVGYAQKYTGGINNGNRALRWDASGNPATEMGNLGTDSGGYTDTEAFAVNNAGTSVGTAQKYTGGTDLGKRAVRWNALGTAATELGNLGTTSSGGTISYAYAINTAGTAVGYAAKYLGGTYLQDRAVRWDASGTAATELSNLGTTSGGITDSYAYAVNTAGTAVGWAQKYTGGTNRGQRAVRWDAFGTAATELGNLGTDSGGNSFINQAYAVNTAGTAVGWASKYTVAGIGLGQRAVRWEASGTAATELGNLGTDSGGFTDNTAEAVNDAGVAVGHATKYLGGVGKGNRAVRWDGLGTAAIELGNLGTSSSGFTDSFATAVNTAGAAVGAAQKYSGGTLLGDRAVLWNSDALAVDLNTMIDPASGWTLTQALGISNTNWVTGLGDFDPDGTGAASAYQRAFLLDAGSLVPEPTGLALLGFGAIAQRRRRR